MKRFLMLLLLTSAAACSSLFPYKDQSVDFLHDMEKSPDDYLGQVVSFSGEVRGINEDALRARLVLKIAVPLYYYIAEKNSPSYELLLVTFDKKSIPQMTGIKRGHELKILARVAGYETRTNLIGAQVSVLHLKAFALANRTTHQDFFRPEAPQRQLYESWKTGRLFFKEYPADIEKKYAVSSPAYSPTQPPITTKEKEIVYDEEDPPFDVNAPAANDKN